MDSLSPSLGFKTQLDLHKGKRKKLIHQRLEQGNKHATMTNFLHVVGYLVRLFLAI